MDDCKSPTSTLPLPNTHLPHTFAIVIFKICKPQHIVKALQWFPNKPIIKFQLSGPAYKKHHLVFVYHLASSLPPPTPFIISVSINLLLLEHTQSQLPPASMCWSISFDYISPSSSTNGWFHSHLQGSDYHLLRKIFLAQPIYLPQQGYFDYTSPNLLATSHYLKLYISFICIVIFQFVFLHQDMNATGQESSILCVSINLLTLSRMLQAYNKSSVIIY